MITNQFALKLKRLLQWALLDSLIIFWAYMLTLSLRVAPASSYQLRNMTLVMIGAAVIITFTWLYVFRTYHRAWHQSSGYSVVSLLKAVFSAMTTVYIMNIIIEPRPLPISVVLVANALIISGVVAIRYRSRLITGIQWRWRAILWKEFPQDTSVRVLIIGAGEAGQMLAWRMCHRFRTTEYKVIGFIDDDPEKLGLYVEDLPVLGNRFTLPDLVKERRIELIVVAINNIDGQSFRELLEICEQTKARIKVIPNMLELLGQVNQVAPLRDVRPEDLIGRSVVQRHTGVDLTPVMHKCVLVTGAAGSIGSELCRQLTSYEPKQLILVDSNESDLHNLFITLKATHPDLKTVRVLADVTNRAGIRSVLETYAPHIIFHAAAYKHVPILEEFPEQALRVNIGGTLNLVELAAEYNVERFVLISTDKAVKPSSIMGASKQTCETIVRAQAQINLGQTRFTAVRFGNVLGSRGSVVPTFNHQIERGGPITITHKDMTRYFMSIDEAANLVIHAACMTNGNEIFLLRMGEKVRIIDIAERMIRLRGLRPYDDIPITFVGVRPGEKLHEELHTYNENPGETDHPHIFKLNGKYAIADGRSVLDQIHHRLEQGFAEHEDPLQVLLAITEMQYQPSLKQA